MSASKSSAENLFELILRFNRRLTFIVSKLSPPLNLNESHVLGEISRRNLTTAAEICRNLLLEKSIVSRLLKGLEKRKLITYEISQSDGRVKHLMLTAEGRSLFDKDDSCRSEQVRICVAALSTHEQSDLCRFLKILADSFQASEVPFHHSDAPLKKEIRRLTRAMGFLGSDLLGTGMSVQECQVMSLTASNRDGASLTEIKEHLPYEASMLSRLVSTLAEQGLISKIGAPVDKRRIILQLAERGVRLWNERCIIAGKRVIEALTKEGVADVKPFLALLEKFLAGNKVMEGLGGSGGNGISLLKGEDQLRRARGFLVREAVRTNQVDNLPERLASPQSLCFAAYHTDQLRGLLEFGRLKGQWHVINFVVSAEIDDENFGFSLLLHGLKTLLEHRGATRISVDIRNNAAKLLGRFKNKAAVENTWILTGTEITDSD